MGAGGALRDTSSSLLVPESTEDICAYCFKVLLAQLRSKPEPKLGAASHHEVGGLFVTWTTSEARLRGCMGTLKPVTLSHGLAHFAIRSSLGDRRFEPVDICEVPGLTCRVSLLHSFEPCKDAYDWELGVHGVHVTFAVHSSPLCPCGSTTCYTATFLPEVMIEHSMTHNIAISKLIHKAGYCGRCDDSLIDSIEATRFQSSMKELPYRDFASRHPAD
mmetsp:Transcript_127533/g.271916  ORF Transcript_127533/g.271916 Transcript_127533/m.271916 type:complete len:218 (+) Transcript_127533:63-716(+)